MKTTDFPGEERNRHSRPAGTLDRPLIVDLSAAAALDPRLTGAKASALARATAAGLPVLDGFVITTDLASSITAAGGIEALRSEERRELRTAYEAISARGTRKLVVRSSSTAEDAEDSSMAGMFSSFLDVRGWDDFVTAVENVLDSRKLVDRGGEHASRAPIAVLVQPQLRAVRGGIMFGVDPVTGARDRFSVVAVEGGPDALVSGRVSGSEYFIARNGRLLRGDAADQKLLRARDRRALASMAEQAERYFGGPQDIEWGIGPDGTLHMFQSRPVTATGAVGEGPIMGPGPVAETFPNPLAPLELELWVEPLKEAIGHALDITGAASKRRVKRSPIIVSVAGRVAADLELFGIAPGKRSLWSRLDPVPPARRLAAAWRVGRLRAAMPSLAATTVAEVDENLERVPALRELGDEQLVHVLERSRRTLVTLHGFEVLAGMLEHEEGSASGAAVALRALAVGRSEGFEEGQIVADSPEVLALTPPSISDPQALPHTTDMAFRCHAPSFELGPREALRLRIRWVQELSARAATELGRRLEAEGVLDEPARVAELSLDELKTASVSLRVPEDLGERRSPLTAPLPSAFRLAADGNAVPVTTGPSRGRPAGGGRSTGRAHHGREPQHGDILIVRTLDPNLAPLLPTIGGLVAETGSSLSHLAILAREFKVPTVVGYEGALEEFGEGAVLTVDGATGEVIEMAETERASAEGER